MNAALAKSIFYKVAFNSYRPLVKFKKRQLIKCISTLFLVTLAASAYGQMDTSKIRITSKHAYSYTFQEMQCDVPGDSTVSDSAFSDVKEITYPVIKTSDLTLQQFINDTIQTIVKANEFPDTLPRVWNYNCIDDKPSEFYVDYKTNFINSRYLSLTIISDETAGGGANGSSHYQTALTFDLQERKILLLKDVVKNKYDSVIYNMVVAQLKALLPDLFGQSEHANNPDLFQFTSTLNLPIAIKKDGIIIYWDVYLGTHPCSEEINIRFDEHTNLFHRKFIKRVLRK